MKLLRTGTIVASLIASLAVASTALADTPTCNGRPVSIVQATNDQITDGTRRDDVILMTHAGTVRAGAGNDIICGSSGNDVIDAGPGNDIVLAGAGRDTITTGSGRDNVFGEAGGDAIDGGSGADFIVGGAGVDRIARQGGDVIASGRFGVSISIPASAVQLLMEVGQNLALTRSSNGMVPVVAAMQPMMMTAASFADYGAFASTSQAMPGATIQPDAFVQTALGSQVTINPDLTLTQSAGQNPQTVVIMNNSQMMLTTGLLQNTSTTTGSQGWQPAFLSSGPTFPYAAAAFMPLNRVTLFAGSNLQPGSVLGSVPQNAATATYSDANPTATFTWDTATNSFVAGASW